MTTGRINQVTFLSGYQHAHSQKHNGKLWTALRPIDTLTQQRAREAPLGSEDCKLRKSTDKPTWGRRFFGFLCQISLHITIDESNSDRSSVRIHAAFQWYALGVSYSTCNPSSTVLQGAGARNGLTNELKIWLPIRYSYKLFNLLRET